METQDDLYDDNEDENYQPPEREDRNIRQLRKKAERDLPAEKQARALAEKERDDAKRELAFVKAGIDTESTLGKLFAKAYDGEPSLDAVKQAAAEYGLIKVDEPSAEEIAQQQALQRLAGAAQGATAPGAHGSVITPADYSAWDSAKRRTFLREHPSAVDALKRGQSIPAIPGF